MTDFERILFIINPAAGGDEPILNIINDVLHPHEITWDVRITQQHGDGQRFAEQAIASGEFDLIAVYGGDGTVADVASGMIGSDIPLMVLPGGTGNALGKAFALPQKLRPAVEAIFTYTPRSIDMGRTENGRYFILRSVVGIGANITNATAREMKDQFGIFAYTLAGFREVQKPPNATYTLTLDGETVETKGVGCVIANTNALGALDLTIHKDVKPDDGVLDVFIIKDIEQSLMNYLTDLSWMRDGAAIVFDHWQAKDIRIECSPVQSVLGDGEYFDDIPLSITTVHHAITLLVPHDE